MRERKKAKEEAAVFKRKEGDPRASQPRKKRGAKESKKRADSLSK